MSLIAEIKASLAKTHPNDVEFKGSASRASRNLNKLLMLSTLTIATLSAAPSFADQVAQSIKSVDSLNAVELTGTGARNLSKALAQGYANKLLTPWPEQNNSDTYSKDELDDQYSAAKHMVSELTRGASEVVAHTESIKFYSSRRDAPPLSKNDLAILHNGALPTGEGESPFSIRPHAQPTQEGKPGKLLDECMVVVPHMNDGALNELAKNELYGQLVTDDPQSKTDVFKFVVYHETAHCLHGMMKNEKLNLSVQTELAVTQSNLISSDHLDFNKLADFKKIALLYSASVERVADSFAALKIQQDYIRFNKEKIISGELPQIHPLLDAIVGLRHRRHDEDKEHDSSSAIKEIIKHLSKPEQLDKLEALNDGELLMTAYQLLDRTYYSAIEAAGLPDKCRLVFPQDYREVAGRLLF